MSKHDPTSRSVPPARFTRPLPLPSEAAYLLGLLLLSLAVAILAKVDLGLSMIVAPAYILSQYLDGVTFGVAEYILQGFFFLLMCLLLRRFRLTYLFSFATCLLYGLILDLWRLLPFLDPRGAADLPPSPWQRGGLFLIGVILTAASVALFFKTYLPPQVYDFFVQTLSTRYSLGIAVCKTCFDLSMLALSIAMSFILFGGFVGIGWGTVIMALVNGPLIGWFSRLYDRLFSFTPLLGRLSSLFEDKPSVSPPCSGKSSLQGK